MDKITARFSSPRAARDRKIEDRVARSVIRAVSIDEIMNDVTLIRSDISRFSRGTIPGFHYSKDKEAIARLTPEQFRVTQQNATERPFHLNNA
jgi:hypothetical protein